MTRPRLPRGLALLLPFALLYPVLAESTRGNVTGAWRLVRGASDLGGSGVPDEGGPSGGPPPGPGGRPPGGGIGGPGGFGRGEPGGVSHEDMKDRMERVRALMEPVERLTITQDGDRVLIVDGEGRSERIVPDAKKEKHLVGNVQAEMKSSWDDGRLVSEIALGRGMDFTRTIGVEEADGVRRLTITLASRGGGDHGRRPCRRVYELIE